MSKKNGSCHCGKVKFEVEIELKEGLSCNCSICQRKGSILSFVSNEQFKLISGESNLTDYQFGKNRIHHTFCSTCGVSAFSSSKKPDGSNGFAINIRCIEGIELEKIPLKFFDGKNL